MSTESAARDLLARVSPHYQDPKAHGFLQFGYSEWVEVSAAIAALTEQSATIALLREALERIQEQQPKTLAMIRDNGFVFEDIGAEPGNWQHLAFSIYTDLCEVESISRQALEALPEQAGSLMRVKDAADAYCKHWNTCNESRMACDALRRCGQGAIRFMALLTAVSGEDGAALGAAEQEAEKNDE